jgi:hypothetical protein
VPPRPHRASRAELAADLGDLDRVLDTGNARLATPRPRLPTCTPRSAMSYANPRGVEPLLGPPTVLRALFGDTETRSQ